MLIIGFQADHDDVTARMKSSKTCVHPSTREGFGIAALEALACGIPVVTVDHPANVIRDRISEKNGRLCKFSAEDLADSIFEIIVRYTEMKNTCIASAAFFDWGVIASTLEAYCQPVIYAKQS